MADASATSVTATTVAAEAEEEVASKQGLEDSAPSSAGGEPSSSTESSLLNQIVKLKADQAALKAAKAKRAKDMKNAVKRKKHLQGRASQLSDTDLVEVLRMRKHQKRRT